MTGAELTKLATELGIDAVGAAPVAPYADTERHIQERRARGLFADMRFTMAKPHVSCHPELLFEGAKTIVAAALCYYREAPEPAIDEGLLPRYTWRDEYAELRGLLDELGRKLGGTYRVLVDETDHVDRAGAVRAGVAFYGKNTMAITHRHGSWVVLGALISDVEVEASPQLDLDCGECTLCIDACPTGALDDPGVLDATKCLSYWMQAPTPIPDEYRGDIGGMVYGCDICQEVCPWNRGIEKRRRGSNAEVARGTVSLREWLDADDLQLVAAFDRLYVPQNDARWLRRNALLAAGNVGSPALTSAVTRYQDAPDEMLRDAASWALTQMAERNE